MASYTSTEVKVGAVTIVAIVLFVLGIMLGQNYRVGVKLHTLTMQFPNSGGIQDGSPVVVNGVKRGSVGTIVNNNGSVLITAILDKIDDLRSDASARITILEITGGKKIEINPGLAVNKLNPGNIIPGKTPADIQELVVLLGDVVVDAVVLLHRIDTIAAEANKIISKGNFSDNVIKTLDNASEAALTLNEWLKKNSLCFKH